MEFTPVVLIEDQPNISISLFGQLVSVAMDFIINGQNGKRINISFIVPSVNDKLARIDIARDNLKNEYEKIKELWLKESNEDIEDYIKFDPDNIFLLNLDPSDYSSDDRINKRVKKIISYVPENAAVLVDVTLFQMNDNDAQDLLRLQKQDYILSHLIYKMLYDRHQKSFLYTQYDESAAIGNMWAEAYKKQYPDLPLPLKIWPRSQIDGGSYCDDRFFISFLQEKHEG
jgi:hypothetical protein